MSSLRSRRKGSSISSNNSLHEACQKGKVRKVKELLEDSSIVKSINVGAGVFGYTPLHEATSSRKPEMIEMLLEKGANVNSISNGQYTPLHIAASIGDLKCIEMLLKDNASVKLLDEFGKTPHRTAELNRRKKAAKLLKTAEVKYAVRDNKEFVRIIENIHPGEDVTVTCFDECLEIAVKENFHFAAGFIVLREPANLVECFKKSLTLDSSRETAAMLLMCISAQLGDTEILKYLCESDRAHKQQVDSNSRIFKKDFFPQEGLISNDLDSLREAVKCVDHAFPVSLACNKNQFDAVKILLFNLYCSEPIKEADWHGLALSCLKDNWVTDISSYKRLYLGWNQLTRLPSNMECLVSLVRLDLQRNHLTEIPSCLLELPVIRNLNIAFNVIQELPAVDCWSPSLNILDVQGNYLISFPENINGTTIEYLNLSGNKLDRVPLSVCELTDLHTLDISGNKDIRELPIQLGNLSKLMELNLKGLQITDPPTNLQKNTKNLIGYLRAKLRTAEPYYTMKLLLIGKANHGKTTLLQRLKGNNNFHDNISTQGIDIQEIQLPRRKGVVVNNVPTFTFRVWDFAGQEEYYATHQCFLSQRSLYLLIWDARNKEKGVLDLKPWLDNLATRVPYSTVIIVGTFMDKVDIDHETYEGMIRDWITTLKASEQHYSKINIGGIANVSSYVKYKDYNRVMDGLRLMIYSVAEGMTQDGKGKSERIMGEQIPLNYKLLEKELDEQQKQRRLRQEIPIMTRDEFLTISQNLKDPLQPEDIESATSFLHNIGTILHYNDPNQDLKNLYFINPSWLCRLMAKIITVEEVHKFIKKGILEIDNLRTFIIREVDHGQFPSQFYEKYLRLLYRFQIACQIDTNRILIPPKLPVKPKSYEEPNDRNLLVRYHSFACIPFGFWERLISRLLLFMKEMLASTNAAAAPTGEDYVDGDTENKRHSFFLNIPVHSTGDDDVSLGEDDENEYEENEGGDQYLPNINSSKDHGVVYVNANVASDPNLTRFISLNGEEFSNNNTDSSTGFSTTTSEESNTVPSITNSYVGASSQSSSSSNDTPNISTTSSYGAVSSVEGRTPGSIEADPDVFIEKAELVVSAGPSETLERSGFTVNNVTVQPQFEPEHEKFNTNSSVLTALDNHHEEEVDKDEVTTASTENTHADVNLVQNGHTVICGDKVVDRTIDFVKTRLTSHLSSFSSETSANEYSVGEKDISCSPTTEQKDMTDGPASTPSSPTTEQKDKTDGPASIPSSPTTEQKDKTDGPASIPSSPTTEQDQTDGPASIPEIPKRVSEFFPDDSLKDEDTALYEAVDIAHLLDKEILRCWKNGIVFNHPQLFFSVKQSKKSLFTGDYRGEMIETKVSNTQLGHRVLGFIIDHIRTLIKEWYPGLAGNDGERPYVNQYIACPVCTRMGIDPPYMFDLQAAFANIYASKNNDYCLPCGRSHCPQVVNIESLCPELLFKDLTKNLQIDESRLEYEEHKDYYLGHGGFGNVYRGIYHTEGEESSDCKQMVVAIKVYSFTEHTLAALDTFHDIRQEIFILSKLRGNPFIVRFIGFVMQPRLRAVMELAEHGSLKQLLKEDAKIPRLSLYQVSLQIASGLDFMHNRRVIHRDIKSANILVFSLKPEVNVKISDFGTANFLAPIGMKVVAGTPGFMAPEMFSYTSYEYTTKVDIYSFAMVFYEMITGRRPFQDYQQIALPEALKRGERPGYSDVTESSFGLFTMNELMVVMWNQESTQRPPAGEIVYQLQNPAFQLLYGKRVLEVPQNPRFLCVVPSTYELWIVCDDKKGSCITILDMYTSVVKDSININGSNYGLAVFNIVQICRIDDDHIAVVLRGTHDVLLIFSVTKKNVVCFEEIEDNFVKCIVSSPGQVFLGYQSGYCQRIPKKHFLKGKLKEGTTMTINKNRQIPSIIYNKEYIIMACGGYIYMCSKDFTPNNESQLKMKRPHAEQYIQELVICPDKKSFLVSFQCCPELQLFDFTTLELLKIVNFEGTIRKLNAYAEPSDMRVTSMCAIYDVLWIGTGSGHILIYSVDSVTNEIDLLTTLHPYKMELRKLCLWKVGPKADKHEVEYLIIATGKELEPKVFGENALCPISSYIDESPHKHSPVKPNPASVTNLNEIQSLPGKIVLMWQAVDAKEMKKLLSLK